MKMSTFIFIILSIFCSAIAFGNDLICRDNYENRFKGSFYLVMNNRFIQELRYAEFTANKKLQYHVVKSLVPNPSNKYMKGGSEYKVEILTSSGLVTGKLSINSPGDQLDLSTNDDGFVLSCEQVML